MENLSKITLGTAQLGVNYGIANKKGALNDEEAIELLKTAWIYNIKSFDTAPAYGDSEKRLGLFFKSNQLNSDLNSFCITTKVGITLNYGTKKDVYEEIRNSISKSLSLLNLNKLHVVLLHRTKDMYNDYVIDSLEKIQDEDLIQKFGVSVYTPKEVDDFIEKDTFEVIQIPFNIFDQRLFHSGLLDRLSRKKILVFSRSAFLQGLFFLNRDTLPEYLLSARPYLLKLDMISKKYGLSVNELALRFMKSFSQIDSVILGMESQDQIIENHKIFEQPMLEKELLDDLLFEFKEIPETIINPSLWKKS